MSKAAARVRGVLSLLLSFVGLESVALGGEGILKVTLAGLRNSRGQVCVAVWGNPADYKKMDFEKGQTSCVSVQAPETTIEITVPSGADLALVALHDENKSGKLDTNFIGMPTEGFAFSNNAKGRFGSPAWEKAVFRMQDRPLDMRLDVIYL